MTFESTNARYAHYTCSRCNMTDRLTLFQEEKEPAAVDCWNCHGKGVSYLTIKADEAIVDVEAEDVTHLRIPEVAQDVAVEQNLD